MSFVYIAGPYQGKTHDHRSYHEIERNISVAREAAAALVREGIPYFCPHLNSAHFEVITPDASADYWRQMDLIFLEYASAMLLLPGWEDSTGTRRERERAIELGLHIYETVEGLAGDWHRGLPTALRKIS